MYVSRRELHLKELAEELTLPDDVDEFVDRFRKIYGDIDRQHSEESLRLQVVEQSSSIAEAVREGRYEQILTHLADFFVWTCGFVGKCKNESTSVCQFDEDFSSVIWLKFPHVCPRCDGNPCACLYRWRELLKREDSQKRERYESVEKKAKATLNSRVRKLDDLEALFEEIYGNNIMLTDIKEIAFHFVEEVGEVSEQIRELRALGEKAERNLSKIDEVKRELRRELADAFSWMVSLLIKVKYLAEVSNPAIKELASITERGPSQELRLSGCKLLRSLLLKYYSEYGKMICRTCRKEQCDLSLHSRVY